MIDTGLIPFFAFSAIMANSDYQTNYYGWSTLFGDDAITYKIIYAFFLTSVVEGGLLICSLILDIYLAVVFRKIAKMPPDMNPLEDNLTARPNGKHKRNKSSMTFEKHLSGSTLATQRLSQIKNASESNFKRVPFVHTRTDSADSVTLYGNEKALNSRVSLRNEISEANTDPYRNSRTINADSRSPSRPTSAITPAVNARAPGAGLEYKPVRSSGLIQNENSSAWLSYQNHRGIPTPLSEMASKELDDEIRPLSPVSMMSEHDLPIERVQSERQNWYSGSPRNSQQKDQVYMPVAQNNISTHDFEYENNQKNLALPQISQQRKRSRDPLGMNPPTPVIDRFQDENDYQSSPQRFSTPPQYRPALHETPVNSPSRPSMSSRPSSFVGSGGKSRYYGNLRDSLGGSPTRETFEIPSPTRRAPPPQSYHEDENNTYARTRTMQSEDSGNFQVYNSGSDTDPDAETSDHQRPLQHTQQHHHDDDEQDHDEDHEDELEYLRHQQVDQIMLGVPQHADHDQWNGNGTRKVSNSTGYDLKTGYAGLSPEFGLGMARRREVSGKVVEEGRGGAGYGNIGFDEVSNGAVLTGQGVRGGAAGWKRFHGL